MVQYVTGGQSVVYTFYDGLLLLMLLVLYPPHLSLVSIRQLYMFNPKCLLEPPIQVIVLAHY